MSVAPMRFAARVAACLLPMPAVTAVAQEFQTALQVAPEWGSRCITVPNGAVAPDLGLQMLDCNNSPAQAFTYDQMKMRLSIDGRTEASRVFVWNSRSGLQAGGPFMVRQNAEANR